MSKTDFVILWVDGSDPAWLEQKMKYSPGEKSIAAADSRFRDWDNLRYWFRGVEKYAPWVNNIYFITWGHLPEWLDTSHPKLKVIKHEDYIPKEYLPTFNSDTIELNLFRIPELSEQFVLFNDDMFLTGHVKEEDFFQGGLPRDSFVESLIAPVGSFEITHTKANMTDVINAHFSKRKVHKKFRSKIYNRKYGKQNFITLYFMPFSYFTGFRNPHIALSHLKSTFKTVWDTCGDRLERSCRNRFRGKDELSHWLMRYWNLCTGKFIPRSVKFGRYFEAGKSDQAICDAIANHSYKTICINDRSTLTDYEKSRDRINAAFEKTLSEKSGFEK